MSWNRNLWGVEFKGGFKEDQPVILGAAWNCKRADPRYEGEPTRALLFDTRQQAREWCWDNTARYTHFGWKFKPVKVRELVEKAD